MTVRRAIVAALFGIVGVAILLGLGVWQVQRLGEKRALIAEIETRLAAAPVAVPSEPETSTRLR